MLSSPSHSVLELCLTSALFGCAEEAGWVPEQPAHSRIRLVNATSDGPPTRQSLHTFMRSLLKVQTLFSFSIICASIKYIALKNAFLVDRSLKDFLASDLFLQTPFL